MQLVSGVQARRHLPLRWVWNVRRVPWSPLRCFPSVYLRKEFQVLYFVYVLFGDDVLHDISVHVSSSICLQQLRNPRAPLSQRSDSHNLTDMALNVIVSNADVPVPVALCRVDWSHQRENNESFEANIRWKRPLVLKVWPPKPVLFALLWQFLECVEVDTAALKEWDGG